MQATDFLLAAEDLMKTEAGDPRQANLREACSATYYALFHTLCETCADMLIGDQDTQRAWTHVYRALEHRKAKDACKHQGMIQRFPTHVQDFANMFWQMQEKRHRADYDPSALYYTSEVKTDIGAARAAIATFHAAPERDRRAFAAYVLLGNPRS